VNGEWIQTLEGRAATPLLLKKDQVGSIEEIAHALAGNFRFTRQTRRFYSVAEHCVRGSELLPPAFAGAFLLHELSEVYLPDIAGPIKPFVWVSILNEEYEEMQAAIGPFESNHCNGGVDIQWSDLERHHTHVMLDALGLKSIEPLIYSPEVKAMDLAMLAAEKRDLCGTPPAPWLEGVEPAECGRIEPWDPSGARAEFLDRFHKLFKTP
jgi:uncharacterized protein